MTDSAKRDAFGNNPYQVVVGNIGTVYEGDDEQTARAIFQKYKRKSENGEGRAAWEDVTLFHYGEPINDHFGVFKD